MTEHTPSPQSVVVPKFGAIVENGWASEDNPTRRGFFVREFKRTGKLNPGRTWEITDGNGKFWEFKPSDIGERLSVSADTDCISLLADLDAGKPVGAEAAAVIRQFIKDREAPAPEGGAVDEAIRLAWGGAMTVACNIAIDEQNRTNDDDGPSEVMNAQGEIIRRLKGVLEIDAGYLAEVHSTLATREEAPAEMFGVTGAVDETEALAVALFAVRCPGVRMTDEDLHFYKSAARSAMRVVSAELSGNPGQLEASAEEGELRADFTRSHPSGMDESTYEKIEDALDRADAPIIGPDGKFLSLAQRVAVLRARPQAREEAQPVAWRVTNKATGHDELFWKPLADLPFNRERFSTEPLYTHPAPAALRVAVEALDAITDLSVNLRHGGTDSMDLHGLSEALSSAIDIAYEALADLQAEQKGGA